MISVYIFARSLLFFYPPSPLPPMQFSALCKQKSAAKKKGKKEKKDSFSFEKFWSFFFSPPPLWQLWHGGKFSSIPFFNSFYHSTRENWLRLILEPNPLSRPGYDLFFLLEGEGEKWEHNLQQRCPCSSFNRRWMKYARCTLFLGENGVKIARRG